MEQRALFSRLDFVFSPTKNIDRVVYSLPNGRTVIGPVFKDVSCTSRYDEQGYHFVTAENSYCHKARFSPFLEGVHKWEAYSGEKLILSGDFKAVDMGELKGFVKVSSDKRYFCLDNGETYVPIGINLDGPEYDLPQGYTSDDYNEDYLSAGVELYKRRITKLSQNGGNFIRISLANPMFNFRTESFGNCKYEAFYNLDQVLAICRKLNVKVMLTLDSFKTLKKDLSLPEKDRRRMRDTLSGRYVTDLDFWINDERLVNKWVREIKEYLNRLWNDPVIMAFELWNEMDAMHTSFENVKQFSEMILPIIKNASPMNMLTNSLSPFDREGKQERYNEFAQMEDMSFMQVHRYLNSSASLKECTESPVEMAATAVDKLKLKDKPLLFSETGAVNGCNQKPFRYYSNDYSGVIFNDCTFVPFFKGAAGTGIMSHVKEYIEPHNLYSCYKPFSEMLHNIKIHKQHFKAMEYARKKAYVFVLKGRSTTLIYVRSKADNWQNVMRDDCQPYMIRGINIPSYSGKKARLYPLYGDEAKPCEITLNSSSFVLPPFRYGYFIKIR